MHKAALVVENLHKTFASGKQKLTVLRGISARFEPHASYAIMGASGSGKSTFMHLLAGLDTPTSGAVYFDGHDLHIMDKKRRALFLQQSVGLVFQLPYLIKELSVLENVMVRGLIAGMSTLEGRTRATQLLEAVGLSDKAFSKPAQLSGGQQQRVAVARAMMTRPSFLLADEPTGSLDEQTGTGMVALLLACQQEWGMTIIVSSHDMYVTHKMKKLYHLKDGLLSDLKDHCGNQ